MDPWRTWQLWNSFAHSMLNFWDEVLLWIVILWDFSNIGFKLMETIGNLNSATLTKKGTTLQAASTRMSDGKPVERQAKQSVHSEWCSARNNVAKIHYSRQRPIKKCETKLLDLTLSQDFHLSIKSVRSSQRICMPWVLSRDCSGRWHVKLPERPAIGLDAFLIPKIASRRVDHLPQQRIVLFDT